MKQFLAFYHRQDKTVFYSYAFSLVLIIVVINSFAIFYPNLPSQIPLFYSLSWGENQLGDLGQFVILPSIIGLSSLVNLLISWQLHESQIVLKRMLAISSLTIALLLTITALKIISIYI